MGLLILLNFVNCDPNQVYIPNFIVRLHYIVSDRQSCTLEENDSSDLQIEVTCEFLFSSVHNKIDSGECVAMFFKPCMCMVKDHDYFLGLSRDLL
jgi:hypothetical protein